jgi:hypothetical protein
MAYSTGWKIDMVMVWVVFFMLLVLLRIGDPDIDFLPTLIGFTVLLVLTVPIWLMIRDHKIKQSCWRYHNLQAMYRNTQKPPEKR